MGANSFLSEKTPFQKGGKNNSDKVASFEIVSNQLKLIISKEPGQTA